MSSILSSFFSSLASAAIADLVAVRSSNEDGRVMVCVEVFQREARSVNTISCSFACKSH